MTTQTANATQTISQWTLGKVKFYNTAKGFGFIERRGAKDIFIHITVLRSSGYTENLPPDKMVEVKYVHGKRGLVAVDVRNPQV